MTATSANPLGKLALIDDAKRASALALVRRGRTYDLGHVLNEHVPVFRGRYFKQTLVTTAHHANPGGGVGENDVNWITELVSGTMQLGTHLDALSHLFHPGWSRHWDQPELYLSGEPGPGCELAQWLADHGVALTGCDTWSYGPVPPRIRIARSVFPRS
jgi:kynurenine formamidase